MRSELIDNWPDFFALEGEWNDLLSQSRADTIFLTWEWIRSWVEVVRESAQPFVIVMRESQGTLAGIAPFYQTQYRLFGTIPYRTLRIMADQSTGAEYPDWMARKDREAGVYQAILKTLCATSGRWECIWMPNMAGWTGAHERILLACQKEGVRYHVRPRDFSSMELPDNFQSYMESLSPNRRSQLRRQMKKVMGRTGVIITQCQTIEELPPFLDALFELHHRRRSRLGDEGSFRRKPNEALFYREFTKKAFRNGWLKLFGLKERGVFKAVQLGYAYRGTFHQMQEGFDPDYLDGVGNVLRAKVIESCISDGVRAYDFLGEMTDHKRRWRAEERTGYDLLIGHRSPKNRLLFVREIWPTGRFLRPFNPDVQPNASKAS